MPSTTPLEAAQNYLALGYWPTPLCPVSERDSDSDKGKKFLWRNWNQKKPSPESLADAYNRHTGAGVGLLLGPDGGLIDIDVDDESIAEPGLNRLFGPTLPETAGWRSAKGYHLLFRWEAGLEQAGAYSAVRQNHPNYPGIDLRIGGAGKIVAATVPPTESRDRKPKEWFRGIDQVQRLSPEALATLIADLQPPPKKEYARPIHAQDWETRERRALKWMNEAEISVSGAGGSPKIWSVGCGLKGFALDKSELLYLLSIYNQSAQPVWLDKDLERLADRIAEKSKEPFGWKLSDREAAPRARRANPTPPPEPPKPANPTPPPHAADFKPVQIVVDFDEWRVNALAQSALALAPNLYQRGGKLVSITTEKQINRLITRPRNSPTIREIRKPILREHLSRVGHWFWPSQLKGEDILTRIYPPDWCVAAIAERGEWDEIPNLESVIEAPTLRPDGSILEKPGYDPETGIVLIPNAKFLPVKARPDIDDAVAGLGHIMAPFSQFFWSNNESKSVWLSLVLTLVIRNAIAGAVPFVVIDASTRGTGKTTLANAANVIAAGRKMPSSSYTHNNPEEIRKTLETTALCGDPVLLYDNVVGWIKDQSLEKAITDHFMSFRILKSHDQAKNIPWRTQIVATGNNTRIGGDMDRRTIWVRLRSLLENPQNRNDLRIVNLLRHLEKNRPALHNHALTACRAFALAGRPKQTARLGGFDDWSEWIRDLLLWCGLPDPVATQSHSREIDEDAAWRNQLIRGWLEMPTCATPTKLREVLAWLDRNIHSGTALRDAFADLGKDGKKPEPRTIGNRLKQMRQRVVGEHYLDFTLDRDGIALWHLHRADGKPVTPSTESQTPLFTPEF